MSTVSQQMPIVHGDNKFALFAQLGDIGRINPRKTFFSLTVAKHPDIGRSTAPKAEIGVFINGVTAEDGSGESWMIEGYIFDDKLALAGWLRRELHSLGTNEFHGLFNTRTRTGFMYAGGTKR